MISGLNSWLDQLADKKIPILKHRRDQILEILNDEERSATECRSIILSDPGMAANLLKAINKERSRELRLPVTTITSLISLFGVPKLKSEIKAMVCIDDLELPEKNVKGIQRCLKQSWYCSQFAMTWVTDRGVREPEEVHLASALQCLPELMLWCYGDDVMIRIEHLAYYECLDYFDEVSNVIGCHKRKIGVGLAKKWFLPELTEFGFESEYNSYTNGTAVALAALLARLCMHGWYGKDIVFFLQKAMHYFGENEIKTLHHLHQQALLMVDDEMEFGYRPIASLLLSTNSERIPEAEYYLQPKKKAAAASTESKTEIVPKANGGIDAVLLDKDIDQLKVLVKQQAAMSDLLKHIVVSLHDTMSFSRVCFLVLSADKSKLESKINKRPQKEGENAMPLKIDLSKQSLFSLIMKKPQAFSLNKSNYDKYWNLVPGNVKTSISVDRFCAASVYFGAKPLGMIYADKLNETITADDFKAFQKMTMMLNKGLELLAKK